MARALLKLVTRPGIAWGKDRKPGRAGPGGV